MLHFLWFLHLLDLTAFSLESLGNSFSLADTDIKMKQICAGHTEFNWTPDLVNFMLGKELYHIFCRTVNQGDRPKKGCKVLILWSAVWCSCKTWSKLVLTACSHMPPSAPILETLLPSFVITWRCTVITCHLSFYYWFGYDCSIALHFLMVAWPKAQFAEVWRKPVLGTLHCDVQLSVEFCQLYPSSSCNECASSLAENVLLCVFSDCCVIRKESLHFWTHPVAASRQHTCEYKPENKLGDNF